MLKGSQPDIHLKKQQHTHKCRLNNIVQPIELAENIRMKNDQQK